MDRPRRVPWVNWEEWKEVHDWVVQAVKKLCSSSSSSSSSRIPDSPNLNTTPGCGRASSSSLKHEKIIMNENVIQTFKIWRARGKVPVAVEATAQLLEAIQTLKVGNAETTTTTNPISSSRAIPVTSDLLLRHSISLILVRFVNGICDAQQRTSRARSVANIAAELNLPRLLVDVRHSATHNQLPTIPLLTMCVIEGLKYLQQYYWEPQSHKLQTNKYYVACWLAKYKTESQFEEDLNKSSSQQSQVCMISRRNIVQQVNSSHTINNVNNTSNTDNNNNTSCHAKESCKNKDKINSKKKNHKISTRNGHGCVNTTLPWKKRLSTSSRSSQNKMMRAQSLVQDLVCHFCSRVVLRDVVIPVLLDGYNFDDERSADTTGLLQKQAFLIPVMQTGVATTSVAAAAVAATMVTRETSSGGKYCESTWYALLEALQASWSGFFLSLAWQLLVRLTNGALSSSHHNTGTGHGHHLRRSALLHWLQFLLCSRWYMMSTVSTAAVEISAVTATHIKDFFSNDKQVSIQKQESQTKKGLQQSRSPALKMSMEHLLAVRNTLLLMIEHSVFVIKPGKMALDVKVDILAILLNAHDNVEKLTDKYQHMCKRMKRSHQKQALHPIQAPHLTYARAIVKANKNKITCSSAQCNSNSIPLLSQPHDVSLKFHKSSKSPTPSESHLEQPVRKRWRRCTNWQPCPVGVTPINLSTVTSFNNSVQSRDVCKSHFDVREWKFVSSKLKKHPTPVHYSHDTVMPQHLEAHGDPMWTLHGSNDTQSELDVSVSLLM